MISDTNPVIPESQLRRANFRAKSRPLNQIGISKVGSVDGAVGYGVNVVMTGERNQQLIAHGQPLEIWPQIPQLAIFGRLEWMVLR